MRMRLLMWAVLALAGVQVAAQSVTISKPGAADVVVDCSVAPGCTIQVTPPAPPLPPPPCTFTVSPTTLTFPAAGGVQGVAVTASREDCPWGTSGSLDWLTLDPGDAQGALWVTAAANTATTARTATLTIAGQAVTVTQAAAALPPPSTVRTLARLDCGVSFPNCNMGYWGANAHHTFTRVGNGFRLDLVPGSSTFLTQFYAGVGGNLVSNSSDTAYIQMHLTIHSPFNPSGVGDNWSDKAFMLNDATGNTGERFIAELRPNMRDDRMVLRAQKNINGPGFMSEVELPLDQRVAVQIEARRGAQGRTAIWIDNADQAVPTAVSPTFAWTVSSWRNVRVGFYHNASLASNGRVAFTVENFRVTDTFDPNFR
jgi:hypothetical protein